MAKETDNPIMGRKLLSQLMVAANGKRSKTKRERIKCQRM
jgi:hypothetical protein